MDGEEGTCQGEAVDGSSVAVGGATTRIGMEVVDAIAILAVEEEEEGIVTVVGIWMVVEGEETAGDLTTIATVIVITTTPVVGGAGEMCMIRVEAAIVTAVGDG